MCANADKGWYGWELFVSKQKLSEGVANPPLVDMILASSPMNSTTMGGDVQASSDMAGIR